MKPAPETAPAEARSDKAHVALASVLLGASIAYSIATLFDWVPHGVAGEWEWAYYPLPLSPAWLFPAATATSVIGVYALHQRGWIGLRTFLIASAALLMIYVISFYFTYSSKMSHALVAILHPDTTGFFEAALAFPELSDIFSPRYESMLPDLPNHANTRLPGPLLVFWSAIHLVGAHPEWSNALSSAMAAFGVDEAVLFRATGSSQAHLQAAFLISLFYAFATAVSVWPVHAFAKVVIGREAAVWVVPLWIFTPALASFYPTFDPTYPACSAAIMWALVRGIEGGSRRHLVYASLFTAAGMFFTFAFTAIIVWGGFYYMAWAISQDRTPVAFWRDHARVFALYVGPFVGFYVFLAVVGQISIVEVFREGVGVTQNVMARVSYFKWVFFFTWNDFFSFAGVLMSTCFFVYLGRTVRCLRSDDPDPDPEQDLERRSAPLLLSYALTLIMLVVSGNTLAEIARLWIFLVPMVTIFGTHTALRLTAPAHGLRWAMLAVAAFQSIVFRAVYGVLIDARPGFF